MISVNNLSINVGSATLLKDCSLEIPSGKLTVLVGKNGAGKSTLLHAVCGDLVPSTGSIQYGEVPIAQLDPKQIAKYRAVILQNSRLSFSFSVLEVVLMGRIPHTRGFELSKDYEIARLCLQKMQILELEHRDYTTLSGGEQQRVQLARALAQIWDKLDGDDTCYLLLDEPTSSLDIAYQHQLFSLLGELTQKGVTVLVVVHDLNLAAQYGDVITVLKDGVQLATGSPEEIFQPQLIQEAFECPVRILHNPHCNCPLVVAAGRYQQKVLRVPEL